MPTKNPDPTKPLFYSCEHGQSNEPCLCHKIVDRNAQTMPDDWFETYVSPGPSGPSDAVSGIPGG